MDMTLTELEDAINFWRMLCPSTGEEQALSREVNALAGVYALMIISRSKSISLESLDDTVKQLLLTWRAERV